MEEQNGRRPKAGFEISGIYFREEYFMVQRVWCSVTVSFFMTLTDMLCKNLIEEGVPVALATDYNAGSCWTCSMQMIMSLACIKMKMTPEEAIVASTVNSACALNREDSVGTLETGKYGDLIICDVPDYSLLPFYFGTNHVVTVIKKGKVLFE
jgi:imidazolonepropionase